MLQYLQVLTPKYIMSHMHLELFAFYAQTSEMCLSLLLWKNLSTPSWRRKWQPTPVFLPGESQGWGSLVDFHLWGRTESDTTEVT